MSEWHCPRRGSGRPWCSTYPRRISAGTVHVSNNPGSDQPAERRGEGVAGVEDGNSRRQLGLGVPGRQEEDASGEVGGFGDADEEAEDDEARVVLDESGGAGDLQTTLSVTF